VQAAVASVVLVGQLEGAVVVVLVAVVVVTCVPVVVDVVELVVVLCVISTNTPPVDVAA
jgi:hypothetical protein